MSNGTVVSSTYQAPTASSKDAADPSPVSLMRAAHVAISPRSQQSIVPHLPSGVSAAISDCSVGHVYGRTLAGIEKELEEVTGETGDLQRDPELAYGNASLTFKEASFYIKTSSGEQKAILEPVSGHFEPGTMVALMGPSGCGKTTLLDILADKKTTSYGGTVHLNGRPRDCLFRRLTSYVAQDDIMFPNLTVKEAVMFHAALKTEVPSGITHQMLQEATELRLRAVGLIEVQDSFIGNEIVRGISGGQRRRVSLACGLATGAQIIFCDEPTSGLSATDAEHCTRYMRLIAKKYGVSIIVAIHQPRSEVAELFDHLLLLTAHPGRVVYNGPLKEAPCYWSAAGFPVPDLMTPTDYFLDLVTPDIADSQADYFVDYYNSHAKFEVDRMVQHELSNQRQTALEMLEVRRQNLLAFGDLPPLQNSVYGVRFSKQLWTVFCRQLRLNLRDQQGVWTEFFVAVAKALLVGMAYTGIGHQDGYAQAGFFFMLLMTCALDGIKVMPKSIQERTIMKLETSEALYSDWAYIISFSAINTTVSFLGNTIFVVLIFLLSQLDWRVYPVVFVWTSLVYLAMDSVYMMVAAIAKDSTSAQMILVPFMTLCLLYNGFTASWNSVPHYMTWALDISPVARAMEELVLGVHNVTGNPDFASLATTLGYEKGTEAAVGVAIGWVIVFRTAQIICLSTLNNVQR